jgi:hypothetical protein
VQKPSLLPRRGCARLLVYLQRRSFLLRCLVKCVLGRVTSRVVYYRKTLPVAYTFWFLSGLPTLPCLFIGWKKVIFKTCIEVDDPCAAAPCRHGGTCVSNTSKFTCHCASGWSGETCETCADSSILFVDPRNPFACLTTEERDFQPVRVHLTLSNFIGDNATRVSWAETATQ